MRLWLSVLIGACLQNHAWSQGDGILHVRIVDAYKGAAIANARITIRSSGGSSPAIKVDQREFRLPPGRYDLTAEARGWVPASTSVYLENGEIWASLVLSLEAPIDCVVPATQGSHQPRRLSLTILDDGHPQPGVWIKVVSVFGSESREAVTGKSGLVQFEVLPNGPYLVMREALPIIGKPVMHDSVCVTTTEVDFSR